MNFDNLEVVGTGEQPYLSVRDFAKRYPTFTENRLRWLIYTDPDNFKNSVLRRIGPQQILISVPDFWNWIERNGKKFPKKEEKYSSQQQ